MKLVILIGNSAAGKMTVEQELMKITKLRLFHNHMTIEPVIEVFGYRDGMAVNRLREVFFEEFAASQLYGMIFTYMWAFDMPSDWDYIEHVKGIFSKHNADIYYAELLASQTVRLERNRTENRLFHKPSKREIEVSERRLLKDDENYRCESYEGEIPFPNYLRINTENLTAKETAEMIKEYFSL